MSLNLGIHSDSEQYSKGEAIKMNEGWGTEANKHECNENDHDNNHPEVLSESFLKVGAMHKDTAQEDAKIATEHTTESQIPSLKRYNSETLRGNPTQQSPQNSRFPAILQLIHDIDGKDNIANKMKVATMQE